jgi:hypothetical protein
MIPPCPLPFPAALFHTAIFQYPSNKGVLHPSCSCVSMRQIMSLSSAIGPNPGPRLHGYPLQFQQTNLKETWVRFDCYSFWHARLTIESLSLLPRTDLASSFLAEEFASSSLLLSYYLVLEGGPNCIITALPL